jgi:alpha-galactosidase
VRRIDTPDDTAWLHGVVAADGSAALMSYVQLAPPPYDRPVTLRLPGSGRPGSGRPGLDPDRRYRITDVTPGERASRWPGRGREAGPAAAEMTGAVLAGAGLDLPALRPLTAAVLFLEAL